MFDDVPRSQSDDDLEVNVQTILRFSREHNPASENTGVLVTNKRLYAQVLEGPAPAVKNLVGHIACDHRIFDDLAMAFVRTNRDLEVEACIFSTGHAQSNITAISAFCTLVRRRLLNGTTFWPSLAIMASVSPTACRRTPQTCAASAPACRRTGRADP